MIRGPGCSPVRIKQAPETAMPFMLDCAIGPWWEGPRTMVFKDK